MNSEATWPELQGSYGLVLLYKHSPVCFVERAVALAGDHA